MAAELVLFASSELHMVHVRPKIVPHYPGYYVGPEMVEYAQQNEKENIDREAQRLLDILVEEVSASGGRVARVHLRVGKPDEEILALAEEIGADLIVIGSRGRGALIRALMESISDSVLRHAHCPVLVARAEEVKDEEAIGNRRLRRGDFSRQACNRFGRENPLRVASRACQ